MYSIQCQYTASERINIYILHHLSRRYHYVSLLKTVTLFNVITDEHTYISNPIKFYSFGVMGNPKYFLFTLSPFLTLNIAIDHHTTALIYITGTHSQLAVFQNFFFFHCLYYFLKLIQIGQFYYCYRFYNRFYLWLSI